MSVRMKLEESPEGLTATLSLRDGDGKLIGHPSVRLVANAAEAKQQAQIVAQSLGFKVYGFTVALPSAFLREAARRPFEQRNACRTKS